MFDKGEAHRALVTALGKKQVQIVRGPLVATNAHWGQNSQLLRVDLFDPFNDKDDAFLGHFHEDYLDDLIAVLTAYKQERGLAKPKKEMPTKCKWESRKKFKPNKRGYND